MQVKKHFCSATTKAVLWIAGIIAVCDQISKLAVNSFIPQGKEIEIIDGFFSLVHLRNKGAAWGMLDDNAFLLGILSVLVLGVLVYNFSRLTENFIERSYSLAAVAGGIVGNCIDRFIRGSVVDFFSFHWDTFYWPAFNIADTAISLGIIIFILSSFLRKEEMDTYSSGN